MSDKLENAVLLLEDGTSYKGKLFGANVSVTGEVGKLLYEHHRYFVLWLGLCSQYTIMKKF